MFKVIVRNFFVFSEELSYCSTVVCRGIITFTEIICHNEENTFIYVHGRSSCSRL